ncbi:MAG: hypothetical protein CL902_00405 [Dehalococcoidia bacterium]|nr:hypothetical protein [Dehalococcoidia bacterium]
MIVVVDNRTDQPPSGDARAKNSMTTELVRTLAEHGHVRVVRSVEDAAGIDLADVRAVVLSGSSKRLVEEDSVRHAMPSVTMVVRALAHTPRIPVLGVCYGWQLLTRLFGGTVVRRPASAPRVYEHDGLYCNHNDSVPVNTAGWKVLSQDAGFVLTAESADGQIVGVQWHPEGTEKGKRWLLDWLGCPK